ncbi:hypothetical protein ARMSODRAFT_1049312, partial [Armillaria solidipes]
IFLMVIVYVTEKTPYVFPIIGGRKAEHLEANIEALDITFTDESIASFGKYTPIRSWIPQQID